MSFQTDRIEAAAKESGVDLRRLDVQDAVAYRTKINALYTDTESCDFSHSRLFECFLDDISAYVEWKSFDVWNPSNFIKTSTVLVFFDVWHHPEDKDVWYVFPSGEKAGEVLLEGALGTHYYTDFEFSYVIAYAEEEILCGAGRATEWAQAVYEQLRNTGRNRDAYSIDLDE